MDGAARGRRSAAKAAAKASSPPPAKPVRAASDAVSLNPEIAAKESLSSLAKKVPEVKWCSDEAKYNRDKLTRNALVHVIDLLEKHPQFCLDCWSWLDEKIHGKTEKNDDVWDESYTNWVKVPKYWLAQWLHKEFPNVLDQKKLDCIDGKDRDAVRRIFSLATMVMPYDVIPKVLLDKQTMSKTLSARAAEVKFPMASFVATAISEDGAVDFACGYPYKFEWENGRVSKCVNMFGEEHTMEEHEVITTTFSLVNGYDPKLAAATKGGMRILLCDLFPEDSKVKTFRLDKKATALTVAGEKVDARLQEAEAASAEGIVDETQIVLQDTVLKENRKRVAEAARAKQQVNKRLRQGTVNLADVVSRPAPSQPVLCDERS